MLSIPGPHTALVQAATHSLVLEGALLLGSPSCLTLGTLPSSSRDEEGQLIEHLFLPGQKPHTVEGTSSRANQNILASD